MINFDDYTNEDKREHNLKRPYIPDHPHRISIKGDSKLEKNKCIIEFDKQSARYW